jgi:hypothetical protein
MKQIRAFAVGCDLGAARKKPAQGIAPQIAASFYFW